MNTVKDLFDLDYIIHFNTESNVVLHIVMIRCNCN